MPVTQHMEPVIGDWYRSHGQLFEVVATDEDERVIEIQHADGSLEEMDLDDWTTRARAGSIGSAEPPEDMALSTDQVHEGEYEPAYVQSTFETMHGLRADSLEDLDLFD